MITFIVPKHRMLQAELVYLHPSRFHESLISVEYRRSIFVCPTPELSPVKFLLVPPSALYGSIVDKSNLNRLYRVTVVSPPEVGGGPCGQSEEEVGLCFAGFGGMFHLPPGLTRNVLQLELASRFILVILLHWFIPRTDAKNLAARFITTLTAFQATGSFRFRSIRGLFAAPFNKSWTFPITTGASPGVFAGFRLSDLGSLKLMTVIAVPDGIFNTTVNVTAPFYAVPTSPPLTAH
ncbi:hypothetical protein BJ508DRAFT_378274 [Ascobolus immersus RN42]|uniref:Uncharacterized protein n=1 Tax=Ascobolus immersus RN42 TaxID=1160509 RepID=A0A3N4HXG9_ASCIM|nr:hypothetical protein BJ508DRAFT_378274 [Ascobolus immersus RN42]